jgi:hypothetical protein
MVSSGSAEAVVVTVRVAATADAVSSETASEDMSFLERKLTTSSSLGRERQL